MTWLPTFRTWQPCKTAHMTAGGFPELLETQDFKKLPQVWILALLEELDQRGNAFRIQEDEQINQRNTVNRVPCFFSHVFYKQVFLGFSPFVRSFSALSVVPTRKSPDVQISKHRYESLLSLDFHCSIQLMRSAASRSPSSHSCQLFSTVKVAAGDADGCFPLSLQAKVMKHYDAFGQTTSIYITNWKCYYTASKLSCSCNDLLTAHEPCALQRATNSCIELHWEVKEKATAATFKKVEVPEIKVATRNSCTQSLFQML